jgi:hypothetical protein
MVLVLVRVVVVSACTPFEMLVPAINTTITETSHSNRADAGAGAKRNARVCSMRCVVFMLPSVGSLNPS